MSADVHRGAFDRAVRILASDGWEKPARELAAAFRYLSLAYVEAQGRLAAIQGVIDMPPLSWEGFDDSGDEQAKADDGPREEQS